MSVSLQPLLCHWDIHHSVTRLSVSVWQISSFLTLYCVLINCSENYFHQGCVCAGRCACVLVCPWLSLESSEQVLARSALGNFWAKQIAVSVFLAAAAAATLVCVSHLYGPWAFVCMWICAHHTNLWGLSSVLSARSLRFFCGHVNFYFLWELKTILTDRP